MVDIAQFGYSVDVSQVEKANAALDRHVDSLDKVEKAQRRAAASANNVGGALANGLNPASRLAAHQIANLTAQVNDLGVSLASGQNPFTVMIQQGFQIVQLFGEGVGVGAALRQTGTAIKNFLLNPLTLATIGFAVALGAAHKFYNYMATSSRQIETALNTQADLVKKLKGEFQGARDAAFDYTRTIQAASILQAKSVLNTLQSNFNAQNPANMSPMGAAFGMPSRVLTTAFGPGIQGYLAGIRSGNPDYLGLRNFIQQAQLANPNNQATQLLGNRITSAISDAAKAQSDLERQRDIVKALEGDWKAWERVIGRTRDTISATSSELAAMAGGDQRFYPRGTTFTRLPNTPMTFSGLNPVPSGPRGIPGLRPQDIYAQTPANYGLAGSPMENWALMREGFQGAASAFVSSLQNTGSALEAFKSALFSIAGKMADIGVNLITGGLFGSPGVYGGGALGNLLRSSSAPGISGSINSAAGIVGSFGTSSKLDPLAAIMRFESGGRNIMNYRFAENPSMYTAGGYYQITNSTWRDIAGSAGINLQQYPTAISAPFDVQRNAATALFQQRGFQPWAPHNPALNSFIQQQGGPGAFAIQNTQQQLAQAQSQFTNSVQSIANTAQNSAQNFQQFPVAINQVLSAAGAQASNPSSSGGFLSSIFGGLFSGGGSMGSAGGFMNVGVRHGGGTIGDLAFAYRRVHSSIFNDAPRLHSGLGPNEFPAILERGERVIRKGQTKEAVAMIQSAPQIIIQGSADKRAIAMMEVRLQEFKAEQDRRLSSLVGVHNKNFTQRKAP